MVKANIKCVLTFFINITFWFRFNTLFRFKKKTLANLELARVPFIIWSQIELL